MEYYITYHFSAYTPANKKAAEMVEIARKWEHIIIEGQISLDAFIMLVDDEIRKLNEKYPRQKELRRKQDYRLYGNNVFVYFPSPDVDASKEQTVFSLSVAKAKGFFRFSEPVPKKEIEV